MIEWVLLILMLGVVGFAAWLAMRGRAEERGRADERRRRFLIPESDERVPVYDDRHARQDPDAPDRISIAERPGSIQAILRTIQEEEAASKADERLAESPAGSIAPLVSRRPQPERVFLPGTPNGSLGRVVKTPDGEMVLTAPPFVARDSIFSPRRGRYVMDLSRRLPPWIALCPRVRLDALVKATPPQGRDPADWREWRRRVRWRAVDVLLCDARSWRPILAIEIGRPDPAPDVRSPWHGAGGTGPSGNTRSEPPDRILEEVFIAIGIPFLRGSGVVSSDWPLIRPYVEESILTTRDVCVEGDGVMHIAAMPIEPDEEVPAPREEGLIGLLAEGLLSDSGDESPGDGKSTQSGA